MQVEVEIPEPVWEVESEFKRVCAERFAKMFSKNESEKS